MLETGLGVGQRLLEEGLTGLQGGGHLAVDVAVDEGVGQGLAVLGAEHQPQQAAGVSLVAAGLAAGLPVRPV